MNKFHFMFIVYYFQFNVMFECSYNLTINNQMGLTSQSPKKLFGILVAIKVVNEKKTRKSAINFIET